MKHIAKRLLSLLLVVSLVLSVAVIPAGAAETKLTSVYASYAAEGHTNAPVADDVFEAKSDSITVSILTTTDMHGRAYDWNSYTNSALSNNFLQAAKLVAERRAAVDDSILIDVGDILQGSALSSYNILQEGGENSPMATALRYIGYDAFVLGNHEFNYAPQIQWNYYNLLTSTDKAVAGQPVDVICSNVVETETNESVFSPYKTFTYKFEDGTTFTIGLLGFENMNNANWDVASHYEGCTFGHPDNAEKSYVYEWENYYGKEMQEKCDYIIVAMHSGEGNPDIYNQENQGGYFATHTTGVDMLLTGHNHQRNAVTLQNKNGENVLVMNGGGSTLGETVLTLTKGADGKVTVTAAESTMHPLNSALGKDENGRDIRVPSPDFKSGDPNYDGLKDLITPLFERSDAFVNKKIGTVSGTWDTISNYYLTQSDSYDLVHKAQIWAACTDNNIDPTKEHVVSMTTPVAKRGWSVSSLLADGATSGDISLRDCYSLYQYDNNTLYMIKMTGAQLKSWMQHTAQNYRVNDNGQVGGGGFGCDTFYGVNYDVYVGKPDGQRVQNITYADGTPVKDDDMIYACLSSYRLSATKDSDAYGWFASTGITSSSEEVLWDATVSERFNNVGGSVPLIIGEYIKEMTAEGKDITPGRETKWTVQVEEDPCEQYTDLDANAWYAESVHFALVNGLFVGYGDGTFRPEAALSRAMVATVLYRQAGSPAVTGTSTFPDLKDDWYADAVAWAQEAKVVIGDDKGLFRPDDDVTREEMVTMLYRFAASQNMDTTTTGDLSNFTDASSVQSYATEPMTWAVGNGIILGMGNNELAPRESATRAQFAAITARLAALK